MHGNITQETLSQMKAALAAGGPELAKAIFPELAKVISVASGFVAYDLQAPAKNLYPTITILRNQIPRVQRRNPGDATHWKVIQSVNGSGYDAMGWVPEGQRSGQMSYSTTPKAAAYVTIGEEDALTFEAEEAAVGFEDVNATLSLRLLQKMMRKEEIGILGGNATLALGTPATPSTGASGSGATIGTNTYSVIVAALTLEGWKNSSLLNGVATTKTITGADGKTYSLNGGSSNKSAAASQAVTLGQNLTATVTSADGAVAYGWFVGLSGAEKLQAITTINSISLASLITTTQLASAVTADCSTNSSAFDGLLPTAMNPANSAYVKKLATGTAGTGTVLTASGRGSCVEVDNMLLGMWDTSRVSPDTIYVSSQEQKGLTTACLGNSTGPLLRYDVPTTPGQPYAIVANGTIEYYYNPFSVTGGTKIPIKIHPDLPPGTLVGWCSRLPEWYQSNEVPNVAEMITRRDYYRVDWPLRTRQREYGVYASEVLAIYAPFGMGVITNIAPSP